MADITIQGLREETVKWLKHRATRQNRSIEEEARYILTDAVKDDLTPEEWTEKALRSRDLSDKMLEMTRGTKQTPSEILIREDRDRGHQS